MNLKPDKVDAATREQVNDYYTLICNAYEACNLIMPNRQVLTPEQARAINVDPGYFKDCSDGVLLTSRGGDRYDRTFMEGFINPGIGPENWVSRTNYPALGVVRVFGRAPGGTGIPAGAFRAVPAGMPVPPYNG